VIIIKWDFGLTPNLAVKQPLQGGTVSVLTATWVGPVPIATSHIDTTTGFPIHSPPRYTISLPKWQKFVKQMHPHKTVLAVVDIRRERCANTRIFLLVLFDYSLYSLETIKNIDQPYHDAILNKAAIINETAPLLLVTLCKAFLPMAAETTRQLNTDSGDVE